MNESVSSWQQAGKYHWISKYDEGHEKKEDIQYLLVVKTTDGHIEIITSYFDTEQKVWTAPMLGVRTITHWMEAPHLPNSLNKL